MNADLLAVSYCACFNLRRAARKITARYDNALRPVGLQATQFTLLAHVDRLAGTHGCLMTELAERLGMDRTTLNRNLRVAEREGWVAVRPGEDRRQRRAQMTSAGRVKLAEAEPLWRAVQARTVEDLGAQEFQQLLVLAARLPD